MGHAVFVSTTLCVCCYHHYRKHKSHSVVTVQENRELFDANTRLRKQRQYVMSIVNELTVPLTAAACYLELAQESELDQDAAILRTKQCFDFARHLVCTIRGNLSVQSPRLMPGEDSRPLSIFLEDSKEDVFSPTLLMKRVFAMVEHANKEHCKLELVDTLSNGGMTLRANVCVFERVLISCLVVCMRLLEKSITVKISGSQKRGDRFMNFVITMSLESTVDIFQEFLGESGNFGLCNIKEIVTTVLSGSLEHDIDRKRIIINVPVQRVHTDSDSPIDHSKCFKINPNTHVICVNSPDRQIIRQQLAVLRLTNITFFDTYKEVERSNLSLNSYVFIVWVNNNVDMTHNALSLAMCCKLRWTNSFVVLVTDTNHIFTFEDNDAYDVILKRPLQMATLRRCLGRKEPKKHVTTVGFDR
jgi:hypothetical protein